jgi:hypothetical protein
MQISVMDANGKLKPFRSIIDDVADAAAKMPEKDPLTYLKFREWFGFDKQMVDFLQQGSQKIKEGREQAVRSGIAKSDWQVAAEAQASTEVETSLRQLANLATLAGVGLWNTAKLITKGLQFMSAATADNDYEVEEETPKERVKATVPPSSGSGSSWQRGMALGGAYKATIENLNVNVHVDKSGNAKVSVDGARTDRVTTNMAPWKAVN